MNAAESAQDSGAVWFYMVRSDPAEPSRDDEFNRWYDEIDIPDVLAVPGFNRARRGVSQSVTGLPDMDLSASGGKYVALYDIESTDIDKTIIDLYVAARRMVALGRLSDVLKVVEANYYRRLVPLHENRKAESAGINRYFVLQKILCCRNVNEFGAYIDWFTSVQSPAADDMPGLMRISLYELYRVMEVVTVPPEQIPHLIVVYEFQHHSAPAVARELHSFFARLKDEGRLTDLHVPGDTALFLQIGELFYREQQEQ
jgi:hypothetical protein